VTVIAVASVTPRTTERPVGLADVREPRVRYGGRRVSALAAVSTPSASPEFVTDDGTEMVFRGTFLEVEPPTRTVETWLYDGWPDADAVETIELHETDGVTTLTISLAFSDKAGRDHMTKFDGFLSSLDRTEIS